MSNASKAKTSEYHVSSTENPSVLSTYFARLKALRAAVAIAQGIRHTSLLSTVGCIALTVMLLALGLTHRNLPAFYAALPVVGVLYFSRRYIRSGRQWRELETRSAYFERGVCRLTGKWQGQSRTGKGFARDRHLYQNDLNVIGNGSLFELLCTTRSELGAERLADYLLEPVSMEESRLRQEAVKELRDASRLREEMNLLGDFRSQDCGHEAFRGWLNLPPITLPAAVRSLLLLSSSVSLLIWLCIFAKVVLWSQWLPTVLVLIAFQTALAGLLHRRVRPSLQQLRLLTNAFTVVHQGLQLIEKQNFRSQKLQEIVERVRTRKASAHLKSLEKLVRLFDQREKAAFQLLSYLLVAGTQLVLAADRWRTEHQLALTGWIDAWAEFEALQALANYAFEQRGCVFPELLDGDPVFEAIHLGHPLLDAEHCVCNDITLNSRLRFYLISGSNMAGKSTILRTIGLNSVIALAGGPVRASKARLSHLTICASLTIADSLLEGKSKFQAEVARLSESIALGRSGRTVLFLIDEILSGTNSNDRRLAAEIVVKTLLAGGAVGAISTHDLALAQIADDPALCGVLVHMESDSPNDPLAFDYLLKPGISTSSNALAIVRMMGISNA
jgi:hypothetical protein